MTSTKLKAASSLVLILGLVSNLSAVFASPYTPPYVFTPNTLIQSSQVNANFSQAASVINNLDNSNITSGAAIDPNKLSNVIAFPTLLMSNSSTVTIGIGVSGDTFPRLELVSGGNILFGPGAGVTPDVGIFRANSTTIAIRDAGNANDRDLTCRNLTVSGTSGTTLAAGYVKSNGTSLTSQAVPIPVTDGGSGLTTITSGSYMKGNGTGAVALQAAPIPVTDGGTGATSFTSGRYLKGNGSGAIATQVVPIPVTDGGSGATSLTGNGVAVVNAGGTALTSVTGTSGQVLKNNGTTWAAGSLATFGGDGSDGALSITTNRTDGSTPTYLNTTSVSVTGTTTWTTSPSLLINCTGTVTIGNGTNTTTVTANAQPNTGGAGAGASSVPLCQPGFGPNPGYCYPVSSSIHAAVPGGGGGGCGGAGGAGGSTTANVSAPGGRSFNTPMVGLIGSGGGGGQNTGASVGGQGGNGGGRIVICAVGAITINNVASIAAPGGNGTSTSSAGGSGGGGSGGVILIASQTSITSGGSSGVSTNGGNGGSSTTGGGGGGGGGGWIISYAPSGGVAAGATGGSAGSGSATTAATAGSAGQNVAITGTPNLPLIVEILDTQLMPKMCRSIPTKTPNEHKFVQREVAAFAADGDVVKYCSLQSGAIESTCGGTIEDDHLLPAA